MNNNSQQEEKLKKQLESLRGFSLSSQEKERMGAFLKSYIDFNPVKDSKKEKNTNKGHSKLLTLFSRFAMPALATFLIVGGGVSIAEKSLPGDKLYSVKTSFETAREHLYITPESKARWNAIRIERRLSEAQTLASEGKLSKDLAGRLARDLDSHTVILKGELDSLRSKNKWTTALEIDGEYRSTARVYKNLLARLSTEGDDLLAVLEDISGTSENNDQLAVARMNDTSSEKDSIAAFGAITTLDSEEKNETAGILNERSEEELVDISTVEGSVEIEGLKDERSRAFPSDSSHSDEDSKNAGRAGDDEENDVSPAVFVRNDEEGEKIEELLNSDIPLEALEALTSARLKNAESSLKNSKLSKDLEKELKDRIKKATELFESAQRKGSTETESRSMFRRALSLAEDVRANVRVSNTVPHSEILKSLLNETTSRSWDSLKNKGLWGEVDRDQRMTDSWENDYQERIKSSTENLKAEVKSAVRGLRIFNKK